MPILNQSGTVYIWYPHGTQVGHASMHIGSHTDDNTRDWYVSWWPSGDDVFMETSDQHTYREDLGDAGEGGPAHVIYQVYGGGINKMKLEWDNIKAKQGSHYDLLKKSCSTIVARILRAGGHDKQLNVLKQISHAHNSYWSPKDVAQWCNQLRDKGVAIKIKDGGCPTKGNSRLYVAMGLR